MLIATALAVVLLAGGLVAVVRRRSSAPSHLTPGRSDPGPTAGFGHYDQGAGYL
ncbi:hypothetical protein AB0368_18710 [Actinoplanes sp. NPDC051475]|uniref:hypothetical protein n=1 Tax=Actinoplanes sp. NPDC051475 TaxID=3157225 RepID=UPI00344C54BC